MFEGRIQRSFEATSRKDLPAVMSLWAEDGVLESPGRSSRGGRYEGKAAIEGFFRRWFERMGPRRRHDRLGTGQHSDSISMTGSAHGLGSAGRSLRSCDPIWAARVVCWRQRWLRSGAHASTGRDRKGP